jgi:thymidylate synthase
MAEKIQNADELYLEGARDILSKGDYQFNGRTKQGTFARFGYMYRSDLSDGKMPFLTTKPIHDKSLIHELLWIIKGDTNIGYLNENNVRIWDEWADENGDLGRVYGAQWRDWRTPDGGSVDQLEKVLNDMKNKPSDRGHIVSAWNAGELDQMNLRPCHALFQFNIVGDQLDCQLYQRSADWLLGVPFNLASYSLLNKMVANELGLEPRHFIHTFGNAHIYLAEGERGQFYEDNQDEFKDRFAQAKNSNDFIEMRGWVMDEAPEVDTGGKRRRGKLLLDDHIPFFLTQFSRSPRDVPTIDLTQGKSLFDMEYDDFTINNYDPHKSLDFEHGGEKFTPSVAI